MTTTIQNYYVYLLLDPTDYYCPFYVGKGRNDRWKAHFQPHGRGENIRKDRKIDKIQSSGETATVLFWAKNLSEDDAYDLEELLIKRFGRKKIDEGGILTNICLDARPPSAWGRVVSDETREKIGSVQRGELNHRYGKSFTDDQKASRSKIAKELGQRPPVRSGPMSEEQKRKISESNKGRKWSEESKQRASEARRGVKRGPPSPETIEKIRQSNIATKRRKWTEGEKAKLSLLRQTAANLMTDEQREAHGEKIRKNWVKRRELYGPSGRKPTSKQ